MEESSVFSLMIFVDNRISECFEQGDCVGKIKYGDCFPALARRHGLNNSIIPKKGVRYFIQRFPSEKRKTWKKDRVGYSS